MQIKSILIAAGLTTTLWAQTAVCNPTSAAAMTFVYINEIHYDNNGGDTNEGVEIAGSAGVDLTGWELVLYNGSDGEIYDSSGTVPLGGTIPDQLNGFGTLAFPVTSLQNGPDGLALVDAGGSLVQFLSYEGVFTAIGGPADGVGSVDIGVAESGSTPIGFSLQLTGMGSAYQDFSWIAESSTFGDPNPRQSFWGETQPVPAPSTLLLFGSGLVGLSKFGRQRKGRSG